MNAAVQNVVNGTSPTVMASKEQTPETTTSTTSVNEEDEVVEREIPTKEKIEKAISECGTLIEALECVGAMYCIPSSHFTCDDNINNIKVVGDKVICPNRKNPSANTKAIVCSIGSVLDHIGQRVTDKINDYQRDNIQKGRLEDSVASQVDPSKGNLIYYDTDENGDFVFFYDSGLIDHAHTIASCKKIGEIKKTVNPFGNLQSKPEIFNDDKDLLDGVNMEVDKIIPAEENCISKNINESAFIIEMQNLYAERDQNALGYHIFQEAGFDYVKPTGNYMIQEATHDIPDLKHMKFDNTGIIKAVNELNAARKEQDEVKIGHLDIQRLIDSAHYKNAIKALEKQFDAHINIRFINARGDDAFTAPNFFENEYRNKITVSKTKGFQMNGLPIDIFFVKHTIENLTPDDRDDLFGQKFVSTLLHEIFHNVYQVMNINNANQLAGLSVAMSTASGARNPASRRKILSEYVDSIEGTMGIKLNKISKRNLVKKLAVMSTALSNEEVESIKKAFEKEDGVSYKDLEALEKEYKKEIKTAKKVRKIKIGGPVVIGGISILNAIFIPYLGSHIAFGIISAGSFLWGGLEVGTKTAIKKIDALFKRDEHLEEHYCDMFAAMYQLPVTWFNVAFINRKDTPYNKETAAKLAEINKLEKEIHNLCYIEYPTIYERSYAGVTAAKAMLDSKNVIDPSLKKYLEWVVNNYSELLNPDLNIGVIDNLFDDRSAKDLDKYLDILITRNNIEVTESAITNIAESMEVLPEGVFPFEYDFFDEAAKKRGGAKANDRDAKDKQRYEERKVAHKRVDNFLNTIDFEHLPSSDKNGLPYIIDKEAKKIYTDKDGILHIPYDQRGRFLKKNADPSEDISGIADTGYKTDDGTKIMTKVSLGGHYAAANKDGITLNKKDILKYGQKQAEPDFRHEGSHVKHEHGSDIVTKDKYLKGKTYTPGVVFSNYGDADSNEPSAWKCKTSFIASGNFYDDMQKHCEKIVKLGDALGTMTSLAKGIFKSPYKDKLQKDKKSDNDPYIDAARDMVKATMDDPFDTPHNVPMEYRADYEACLHSKYSPAEYIKSLEVGYKTLEFKQNGIIDSAAEGFGYTELKKLKDKLKTTNSKSYKNEILKEILDKNESIIRKDAWANTITEDGLVKLSKICDAIENIKSEINEPVRKNIDTSKIVKTVKNLKKSLSDLKDKIIKSKGIKGSVEYKSVKEVLDESVSLVFNLGQAMTDIENRKNFLIKMFGKKGYYSRNKSDWKKEYHYQGLDYEMIFTEEDVSEICEEHGYSYDEFINTLVEYCNDNQIALGSVYVETCEN